MTEPNETPAPESKDVAPSEVTANVVQPSGVPRGGPTRKGHSNGLRVHSIVFGTIALGVLIALGVALLIIAGSDMM